MLTHEQLHKVMPTCPPRRIALFLPYVNAALVEAKATTRLRACAFLAQIGTESGDLKYTEEIASGDAYDTRTDLGNTPERDGDGRKFKGRGLIQTTGKDNYTRAAGFLKLPLLTRPELLSLPVNAARSAAFFWSDKRLNHLADKLNGRGDARDLANFDRITRKVNGGYNHRVDRQRRYLVALSVLKSDFVITPAPVAPSVPVPVAPQAPQPSAPANADVLQSAARVAMRRADPNRAVAVAKSIALGIVGMNLHGKIAVAAAVAVAIYFVFRYRATIFPFAKQATLDALELKGAA